MSNIALASLFFKIKTKSIYYFLLKLFNYYQNTFLRIKKEV